eukprot:jgi/Mesvir1/634/Mv17250-RA.1
MAEEESIDDILAFDPSKKKKKKKKPVEDAEGAEAPQEEAAAVTEKLEELTVADDEDPNAMFAGLKKKKKKKKPVEGEGGEGEGGAGAEGAEGGEGGGEDEDKKDDLESFGLTSKKKKKKKRPTDGEAAVGEGDAEGGAAVESAGDAPKKSATKSFGLPWEGSDRDYHYEELLDRVFGILRANNPELAGEKRRTNMKPPQVLREGTKRTVFVNFMELCKSMHRQPDHVMAFLLAELGTSGSLDGQQRLIVKGRFLPKVFEGILRRYVNEYVLCNGCKSPDTILHKENRLFFLRCEQCGSSRSVAPIKAGFVARVGRRKLSAA